MNPSTVPADRSLLARRLATLGPHAPIFYDEPLELVSGSGVWLHGADGVDYLDAYNNVPVVGHSNPRVQRAVADQIGVLNTHTRYLTDAVVDYAERLIALFPAAIAAMVANVLLRERRDRRRAEAEAAAETPPVTGQDAPAET